MSSDAHTPIKKQQARARTGKPRSNYHHGDLRRALIDAALNMTLQQGAGTFTLADLCRSVGVSAAAPYRHFESLDQLLAETAHEGFALLDEKTKSSFRGPDWEARLASCVGDYLGFIRAHPAHAIIMFATRTQTVDQPHFDPIQPPVFPEPKNATEAAIFSCWEAGLASFNHYAQGLALALADSPLAPAISSRQRKLETALALFTMMQGIAAQWLDHALPEDWLTHNARKSFNNIVLPWALGLMLQHQTRSAKPPKRQQS